MNDSSHNEGQSISPINQECLISIVEIGFACSVEFPRERMNRSTVITYN